MIRNVTVGWRKGLVMAVVSLGFVFSENVTNFWLSDKRHLLSDYWDEISERNSSVNYLSFI